MASSAASASSTNILTSLPARPPTPPREASYDVDVDVSLRSVLGRSQAFDPRRSLQTPPNAHSPASSAATGSNPSSARIRKKVEWSNHTEYKDPPEYRDGGRLAKTSPLSAATPVSLKPIKGILKPSSSPNPLASSLGIELDGTAIQPNIIEMLDSTIKQLAGSDRDSKLDAYMMLARALKTSNNLPDRVALQDKMSLFMQFIQRDITSKNENGALDTSLVNHALTLLATFLHFPAIASTLNSEFGVFIIDHSIRSFEDANMPKDVVRHLMQVVAFQSFSAKVMTPDRVGRLLGALHKIEDHLKGKSIVMSRLHIYKRLVQQSRSCMATHSDWLKDMLTDMLSSIRDIRSQAISLGTEAGFALRSNKLLFRKAAEIFKATNDDETYIDFYIKRLQEMLKEKQTTSAVPQIWSVVILFLRCPLDRWQYYSPWLILVQSAFNMTDGVTKQEANYAWNRYVYLSLLDSKMSSKAIGTLCQPLLSQLRRKTNAKQQEEAMKLRRVVIGGVCSLYYFAFAQGTDKYPNEVIWDAAVQPIMTQLISLDGKPDVPGDCMMQAARMLVGLLDVSTPRPSRNMDRILDTTPLGPEELLPIDSKWVRRNCDKVLQAVGPILEKKFADLANTESLVFRLWQALVSSVGAASVKDIKVSDDTAKFFACSFGLLSKVWSKGLGGDDGSVNAKLLPSVKHFIQLMVDKIGILPFTEKKLYTGVANTFEAVIAPLQRLDKNEKLHGTVRMPLHHLFSMLCSAPPGCTDDEALGNFFQSVFEPFFKARANDKGRGDLARELVQLLPRTSPTPFGPWLLAAEYMKLSLDSSPTGSAPRASGSEKLLGPIYRELVSLLERGLTCHPSLPVTHWKSLFDFVSTNVLQEFGDAGRALVVIEPLAKVVLDISTNSAAPSSMTIQAVTMLLDSAKLPRDRQALESARLKLWGVPPAVGKAGSSDPFDNLYRLCNHMMELFYDKYTDIEGHGEVDAFVGAVEKFLDRCLSQAGIKTISKMQPGLCSWVQDEKTQLRMSDKSSIYRTLRQLWDRVCIELTSHGRLEKKDFDQVEPLLTAAFKSKDSFILSRAADVWNAAVKDEEKPECSDSLLSIVSSLRSKVDLVVPGADPSSGDFGAQAPPSIGHPGDQSFVAISSASSRHDSNQAAAPVVPVSRRPATRKRRLELTTEVCEKPAKRKSARRLRHDDSQMQFAPIAPSSPQHDESQHLTDRQMEVRERQRGNAALYPDIRSSSPAASLEVVPKKSKDEDTADSERLARDTTPKHNTSFDELISSTPTPRRGQVLPMDDANDPPSSPPLPRPYPLLSQIQSRSRANSSLENWEFSSPTGSPVASHQQQTAAQDEEPAPPALTEVSQPRARRAAKRQRRAAAKERATAKVIPSSITDDEQSGTDSQTKNKTPLPADPPATPPQRHLELPSQIQETPKSGEDEFVDARSNPEQSPSSHQPELSARGGHPRDGAKDTSFALSEGEEMSMMNLVAELESRRSELPMAGGDSPPKKSASEDVEMDGCITAQRDSPSPPGPTTRRGSKRSASLVVPSTPAEVTDKEADGGGKRKRKRGGQKHAEFGGKRRRPAETENTRQPEDLPKANSPAPMETRGSSRKRKQRIAGAPDAKVADLQADQEAASTERTEGPDAEDTEEELMSQLATESFAASQQNHSHADDVPCQTTNEGPTKSTGSANTTLERTTDAEPREEHADGGDETLPIMETLRSGLDQLRKTALTRARVYEMETVLMDLKRELYEAERRGREGKESA